MTIRRILATCAMMLCVCLPLVACTSGTSTTGNTTAPNAKVSAPTAAPTVAKTKPTSVPLTDLAFCQRILSLAEANQFMNPPTPATTIIPNNTSGGGSCNYEYGPHQITLAIILQPYTGPLPVTQQEINALVTEGLSEAGANGITVNTVQMVSGVGDQAAFVSITTSTPIIPRVTIFYVLYGKIWFDCVNYFNVGSSSDATQMSGLQQCAQTVVSRL